MSTFTHGTIGTTKGQSLEARVINVGSSLDFDLHLFRNKNSSSFRGNLLLPAHEMNVTELIHHQYSQCAIFSPPLVLVAAVAPCPLQSCCRITILFLRTVREI